MTTPHDLQSVEKANRPAAERAAMLFRRRFGRSPEVLVRAPGRVNLLGGHIDYHGGPVLPGAIDLALWVAAAPRHGRRLMAVSESFPERSCDLDLTDLGPPSDPRWFHYPAGVAWAARTRGLDPVGLEAAVASDLPSGAGVSSSAALEVAFGLAWRELGLDIEPRLIASLGREAENQFLGIGSGIMDQFACLHGRHDHLVYLDCRSMEWSLVPLPDGLAILAFDSGVNRRLVDSEFTDRRRECERAQAVLIRNGFELRTLRDLEASDLDRAEALLPPSLARRVRHVVTECERVEAGARALAQGDVERFGSLVFASHESSRANYETSIPELDSLVNAAGQERGCLGARLSGGGFGGCVTALVREERVEAVARAVADDFVRRYRRRPAIWRCRIDDGAQCFLPE